MSEESQPDPAMSPEDSAIFGHGLADRLFDKYGDDLRAQSPADLDPVTANEFPYEPRGEVARGGMGIIDEVWDPILRRPLAMKRVREDGGGSAGNRLHRFLREARITAQLDHPGVVPVHELRLDPDGAPYFTMRLVLGRDLRAVLRAARKGRDGWNLTRAIEVLIKVCDTLAFAHSHGVIHRDLKPANIMVGEFGEVYVMDWGLAKVIGETERDGADDGEGLGDLTSPASPGESDVTLAGSVLGTPFYMAPEQGAGDLAQVGPAVDVYAVGAMLYLLLTGQAPYAPLTEANAVIEALRSGPPTPVRERAPEASPMLAAICEQAMARDASHRTPGMTALADAFRGVLEAEQEAREEAERAREEAKRASAVSSFMKELFLHADPAIHRGKEISAREVLDRGAERLAQDLDDQPLVRADLMNTMGDIYLSLGDYERARALQEEALEMYRRAHGVESLECARSLASLGVVHQAMADYAGAERLARERLAILRKLRDPDHQDIATVLNDLAVCLMNLGGFREAEEHLGEALRILEPKSGGRHLATGQIYNNFGSLYGHEGREDAAEPWYRRALAHNREVLGSSHPEVAINLNNLAGALRILGKHEEAEQCYRESLELRRHLFGSEHPKVATSLNALGSFMITRRCYDESESMLREALAIHLRTRGEDHTAVAASCHNLADVLRFKGELEEAEEFARRAIAIRRRVLGDDNMEVAKGLHCLGAVLIERDELVEAQEVLEEAVAICRRVDLLHHYSALNVVSELARVYLRTLRFSEAEGLLRETVQAHVRPAKGHRLHGQWVLALAGLGRRDEATKLGREFLGSSKNTAIVRTEFARVADIAHAAGETRAAQDLEEVRTTLFGD